MYTKRILSFKISFTTHYFLELSLNIINDTDGKENVIEFFMFVILN